MIGVEKVIDNQKEDGRKPSPAFYLGRAGREVCLRQASKQSMIEAD